MWTSLEKHRLILYTPASGETNRALDLKWRSKLAPQTASSGNNLWGVSRDIHTK